MRIAVAQLGARRHYAVPRILHRAGILERLYTDICAVKGWPRLLGLIPPSLRPAGVERLLGRVPRGIPPDRITTLDRFGRKYVQRRQAVCTRTESTAVDLWAGDRFNELILRHGLDGADVVYGFKSACLRLFEAAKERHLCTVVDQVAVPRLAMERILKTEFAEASEWAVQQTGENSEEYACREKREWALADLIVCGSEFVREHVAAEGGPVEKCVVVPYGVELTDFAVVERTPRRAGDPLRTLFVGQTSLLKGIRHLLGAMRQLEAVPVRCRIIGGLSVDSDVLRRHTPPNVELVGPVPRCEVAREYAGADVFCLPSLCEGSAAVIYEALAAGLPVVTTPNAGSIVRDGVEGFIVPVRDSESLADRIRRLAVEPELLHEMSIAARDRSRYGSLEAYSERLLGALGSLPGHEGGAS